MTTRWIIGLASGTSADSVDAALLQVEGIGLNIGVRLIQASQQALPRDLREMLLKIGGPGPIETRQASLLHRLLGEVFGTAARQVADQAHFSLQKVQCLGCPGHTVWHEPEGRFPSTLGLGMPAVVAERTGITTVSDFRSRDVAAGGQGVPLAALVDYLLFRHPQEDRILLHLGGVSRIVYVPAGGRIQSVIGFEAGPCSGFLDLLMRKLTGGREPFDPGGKHAVQGRCIEELLERWLGHPYFQRRPPKGMSRQAFGEEFIGQVMQTTRQMNWSLHDVLCTATHFVARAITQSLQKFLPEGRPMPPSTGRQRVLLSGGGVRNGLLWHLLEQQLAGVVLEKTDCLGVPFDGRKSLAFGMMAALTVDGVPANVPSATGATGARLLGSLTPGSAANWARCVSWMAAQTALPAVA